MNAAVAKALMSENMIGSEYFTGPEDDGIDLHANYFELFARPVSYPVERSAIQPRYLELQRLVHPDRFAAHGEQGQRLAMQYATFVNEAFETLCSPLKSAEYLLELGGHPLDAERNTVMDTAFLMEQLSLREELSEVLNSTDPESAIEELRERAEALMTSLQTEFLDYWQAQSFVQAQECVRKMYFAEKLLAEVEQLEEAIFDN